MAQTKLTYLRYRQSHGHGHTHKKGRQQDLGEKALCVPLCAVKPLDEEAMKLTQLQPPAIQLEAALSLQDCFRGWGVLFIYWRRKEMIDRLNSENHNDIGPAAFCEEV